MEVRNQVAARQRQWGRATAQVCLSFLHARVKRFMLCFLSVWLNVCLVYSECPQDSSEYLQFLKESHREALEEEERRYRFLAEKHCGLIQSIGQLMNKV